MADTADIYCSFASRVKLKQITLGLFILCFAGLVFTILFYSQMATVHFRLKDSANKISKSIQDFRENIQATSNSTNFTSLSIDIKTHLTSAEFTTINTKITTLPIFKEAAGELPPCPISPPNIKGQQVVDQTPSSMEDIKNLYPDLEIGGHHFPSDCKARSKVAIIIPYRDREAHLLVFLRHMHAFLRRQQLDYGIFVVELKANFTFNRAMLMNIGYVEANRFYDWECYTFHDVDLIPENDRNLYTCPDSPRHMSVAVSTLNYKLPYETIFGGVTSLKKEHFEIVNGYSNVFFGWGGEDDDMWNRINKNHLTVTRYTPGIARYKMLSHKKDKGNPHRVRLLNSGMSRWKNDGLNTLQYLVHSRDILPLYVRVLVSYDPQLEIKARSLKRL